MNKIKTIIIVFAIVIAFVTGTQFSQPVSADVAGLRAAIITAFSNNLTAQNRQEVIDSFSTYFAREWAAGVAAGTYANTNTGKGQFTADKVLDFVKDVRSAEMRKTSINAVPTPTPLP